MTHRPKGGDAHQSQGEYCKCCIGSNQYAIGFQLFEVSDTESTRSTFLFFLPSSNAFPSSSVCRDCQSIPKFPASHSTNLSTTFARIGLIMLHRRIGISLSFHDGNTHTLSSVPTDSLCSFAPACEVQGVLEWGRFLIATGSANYVYMRIQYSVIRVLSSAAGSDQPRREVRRGEAGLEGMRQGAERTADGG